MAVFKIYVIGAGKMVQRLRMLTALAHGLSLVPRTHIRGLTTAYNSSTRGPKTSDLFRLLNSCARTPTQALCEVSDSQGFGKTSGAGRWPSCIASTQPISIASRLINGRKLSGPPGWHYFFL